VRYSDVADSDCAIAQALGVVGDWWTLLVVRDLAGGLTKFSELAAELGISRKVLTERLDGLLEQGVVERRQYAERPPRFEYHLTERGRGLLPVLVALQDWGGRYLMGDGSITATSSATSREAGRVRGLVGHRVPQLELSSAAGQRPADPVAAPPAWTVLYVFPNARGPASSPHPPGWSDIPGAAGCTMESRTYQDRLTEFANRGAAVQGVSTQRADELADFARHHKIDFPLLSDENLRLTTALRLPTFRAGGAERLKRLTLLIDDSRQIRSVIYPIPDPVASVSEALHRLDTLR
jgi:DNA-binding HxlR family transcriptional regulator/peroxiredoxin